MSYEHLNNLSDAELHYKLLEYGFPSMPITETTRKILIKKLENHMRNVKQRHKRESLNNMENKVQQDRSNYLYPQYCEPQQAHRQQNGKQSYSNMYNFYSTDRALDYSLPNNFASQHNAIRPSNVFSPSEAVGQCSAADRSFGSDNSSLSSNDDPQNPHFGIVDRLLKMRDITLRKQRQSMQNVYSTNNLSTDPKHKQLAAKKLNRCRTNIVYQSDHMTPPMPVNVSNIDESSRLQHIFMHNGFTWAFILFFVILACMYMVIRPVLPNSFHSNGTLLSACDESDVAKCAQNLPDTICTESDAFVINKELIRLLLERSEQHYCVDEDQPEAVSVSEFARYLNKDVDIRINTRNLLRCLKASEYIMDDNPQWKYNMIDANGMTVTFKVRDAVLPTQDVYFVLLNPHLPLMCVLYNKMQRFFSIIGTGFILGVVVPCLAYLAYRYLREWQRERNLLIEKYTTDIINEFLYASYVSDLPEDREFVVIHLRDQILPLHKRSSKYLWAWNEALRILKANDSRIEFSISIRNGVEVEVMKWMGTQITTKPTPIANGAKQWHSPAFYNTNKIANPPTSCLKIRHMFDFSETNLPNLKQIMENAILEKVESRSNISDIQIDKESCCVYVRCASEKDAGIVHNAINGWWFDKHLVSIKFLRLQRYLSRFPKSG